MYSRSLNFLLFICGDPCKSVSYIKSPPAPCSRLSVNGWKKNLANHAGRQAIHTKKAHTIPRWHELFLKAYPVRKICLRIQPFFSFAPLGIFPDLLKIRCEASCASRSVAALTETQFQFLQIEAIDFFSKSDSKNGLYLKSKICHNVATVNELKKQNRPFFAFHTQYSNFPIFHHSRRFIKIMAAKNTVIPVNCRSSDTFNYPYFQFRQLNEPNKPNQLNKLINSPIPLRILLEKPLNNIQISLQLKSAMDFFPNFASIFERL